MIYSSCSEAVNSSFTSSEQESSQSQAFTQTLLSLSYFNFLFRLLKPAEISFSSSSTEADSFRNSSININVGGLSTLTWRLNLLCQPENGNNIIQYAHMAPVLKKPVNNIHFQAIVTPPNIWYHIGCLGLILINQIPPIGFVATFVPTNFIQMNFYPDVISNSFTT